MDIGVRDLKAKLSEYLDGAERGEVIAVTERGRPKATVAPLPGQLNLDQGVEEGWVTLPTRQGLVEPLAGQRANRSVLDVLAEDRGS